MPFLPTIAIPCDPLIPYRHLHHPPEEDHHHHLPSRQASVDDHGSPWSEVRPGSRKAGRHVSQPSRTSAYHLARLALAASLDAHLRGGNQTVRYCKKKESCSMRCSASGARRSATSRPIGPVVHARKKGGAESAWTHGVWRSTAAVSWPCTRLFVPSVWNHCQTPREQRARVGLSHLCLENAQSRCVRESPTRRFIVCR